jgi:hypothetical protein
MTSSANVRLARALFHYNVWLTLQKFSTYMTIMTVGVSWLITLGRGTGVCVCVCVCACVQKTTMGIWNFNVRRRQIINRGMIS